MADDMGDKASRQELSEKRTDFAEDRTVLANERTFAGWFRTGLGSVAIGLGFQALFVRMEPEWVPRSIATAFLLIGIFIFISAERRASDVLDRLNVHKVEPESNFRMRLMTIIASIAVAALVASVWLLPITPRIQD